MKKYTSLFFAIAMLFSITFIGQTISADAQQTSVRRRQPVRGVVSGSKYVYRKSKQGVVYAGRKTYQGGKYVGKKTYQGGKYVGKKTVRGTRKVISRTKKIIIN